MENQNENPKSISKEEIANRKKILSKGMQSEIESLLIDSPKGGGNNSQSLYNISNWDNLGDKIKRGIRSKIRRNLENHISGILGKDRNEKERIENILHFLEIFKKGDSINIGESSINWKYSNNSKLIPSSLYEGNNDSKRKNLQNMIKMIEIIGKKSPAIAKEIKGLI